MKLVNHIHAKKLILCSNTCLSRNNCSSQIYFKLLRISAFGRIRCCCTYIVCKRWPLLGDLNLKTSKHLHNCGACVINTLIQLQVKVWKSWKSLLAFSCIIIVKAFAESSTEFYP